MRIARTNNVPNVKANSVKTEAKAAETSAPATTPEAPSESFASSVAMDVLPVGLGLVGATAGLVGGFADGTLGTVARAVAFAGIGGGLGMLHSLGADTSGNGGANYPLTTAIGAAGGAAIGAFALSDGGLVTGIAGTVLGGWGAAASGIVLGQSILD